MLWTMSVAGLLFFACSVFAQSAAPRPEFEVASIKLNKSADFRAMMRPSRGGRFSATNFPLQFLIAKAYKVRDFQLSGAPSWLLSERYDIEAKAEGDPAPETILSMLQTLVEDRLQFTLSAGVRSDRAEGGVLAGADRDCAITLWFVQPFMQVCR